MGRAEHIDEPSGDGRPCAVHGDLQLREAKCQDVVPATPLRAPLGEISPLAGFLNAVAPQMGNLAESPWPQRQDTPPLHSPELSRDAHAIRRILVCVDRSPFSEGCLMHAIAVAAGLGSAITLLHVMEAPHERYGSHTADVVDWEISRQEADARLEQLCGRGSRPGYDRLGSRLEQGHPAERITAVARELDADLTVLAGHGERGLSAWSLGSTVQQVLSMTHGSVLIARSPRGPAPRRLAQAHPRPARRLAANRERACRLPRGSRARTAPSCCSCSSCPSPSPRRCCAQGTLELARELASRLERRGREYLERVREQLARDGAPVRTVVLRSNDERRALLDLSEREAATSSSSRRTGSTCIPASTFGSVTTYAAPALRRLRARAARPAGHQPAGARRESQRATTASELRGVHLNAAETDATRRDASAKALAAGRAGPRGRAAGGASRPGRGAAARTLPAFSARSRPGARPHLSVDPPGRRRGRAEGRRVVSRQLLPDPPRRAAGRRGPSAGLRRATARARLGRPRRACRGSTRSRAPSCRGASCRDRRSRRSRASSTPTRRSRRSRSPSSGRCRRCSGSACCAASCTFSRSCTCPCTVAGERAAIAPRAPRRRRALAGPGRRRRAVDPRAAPALGARLEGASSRSTNRVEAILRRDPAQRLRADGLRDLRRVPEDRRRARLGDRGRRSRTSPSTPCELARQRARGPAPRSRRLLPRGRGTPRARGAARVPPAVASSALRRALHATADARLSVGPRALHWRARSLALALVAGAVPGPRASRSGLRRPCSRLGPGLDRRRHARSVGLSRLLAAAPAAQARLRRRACPTSCETARRDPHAPRARARTWTDAPADRAPLPLEPRSPLRVRASHRRRRLRDGAGRRDARSRARRAGNRRAQRRPRRGGGRGPFHLLHRKPRWNAAEERFMGWERKRGKLEELNRLLAGRTDTSYTRHVGRPGRAPRDPLRHHASTATPSFRWEPRGGWSASSRIPSTARSFDDGDGAGRLRATRSSSLASRCRRRARAQTRFSRIFAGDVGFDIYTHAVSESYQDLFGAGIYVGKGIYDVDAFMRSVEGRVPENALASHDLFEGIARRARRSRRDIVLFEDYPSQLRGVREAHAPVGARRLAAPAVAVPQGALGRREADPQPARPHRPLEDRRQPPSQPDEPAALRCSSCSGWIVAARARRCSGRSAPLAVLLAPALPGARPGDRRRRAAEPRALRSGARLPRARGRGRGRRGGRACSSG